MSIQYLVGFAVALFGLSVITEPLARWLRLPQPLLLVAFGAANLGIILFFAIGGMLLTAVLSAVLIFWGVGHPSGFPWIAALITGALALASPATLDYWWTNQSMAFGVVLFTLFVQAPTMPWLIRRAGIPQAEHDGPQEHPA